MAAADLARYRELFDLQRAARLGRGRAADGELEDDLLLGHRAGRSAYSRPKAPRADYAELAAWLERYADLPQAARIYKLALARKPAGAAKPRAPEPSPSRRIATGFGSRASPAWRGGDVAGAADRFTRLADDATARSARAARAAFWAARANLRARRPQLVVPLLRIAAEGSDEFYGALAQRMLDDVVDFDRRRAPRASWHARRC